jgi:acyl-CoA synthetase (AMP-forming)/AMP-acid ligase II/acyl carrier protein
LPSNDAEWTVAAQLRRRALEGPEELAHRLVGVADLTFGIWDEQSNAAARGLRARGVGPGDRVLLPCSTAEWISYAVAWAGVLKAGAVAVPVSVATGAAQLARTSVAAGAVGVVGTDFAGRGSGWCATVAELVADQPVNPVHVDISPDDDAEIVYTSGTTGVPKGVVASHANVMYSVMGSTATRRSTAMHALPPATTVGQGLLVQPLGPCPHATLTLPRFEPATFLRAIEEHRPTHVVLVPAMAIALVNAGAREDFDLTSVRQVRTTSAPIHPATLEQLAQVFPNARIRNVYSTTECWPRRLATTYDRARPRSLGRPAPGAEVRIVASDGAEVPRGLPGDVQLRSDAPQRRYDGAEAASGVFLEGGWTRTGDIGMLDEDGYFYLVDRHPDLINTGGMNVSTLDTEATVMDYPGVVEAAVCGVPHPVLTECVVAAVRVTPGVDVEALHDFLRERRGVAAPHRVIVVADLPRTLLGKIDKRALRTMLAAEVTPAGHEPPATPTEEAVAGIWATALDVDAVSATADFLHLGGSSLSAMEVVSEVAERLGRAVRVRDLLDTQTLREFARRVDDAPPAEPGEPDFVALPRVNAVP